MASRWNQQQQQQQKRRQPGQMGMALGGEGGLSRSPSGPMDTRWATGNSPPGLSLRTREDGVGGGTGGLDGGRERTDGSSPMTREGREEKFASRWTQQQQQQQQWRLHGQMGMAAGGGGGLSRSRPSPMDARWSTGDSPPGLSLRTREDGGGEGAGGLDQSWPLGGGGGGVGGHSTYSTHQSSSSSPRLRDPRTPEDGCIEGAGGLDQSWSLGGGDGGVGGHSSYQPLSPSSRMRNTFDPRQWGGGGGESPADWDGQALRAGWGGESGPL